MGEFVEKLIERLEEEVKSTREMQTIQCVGNNGYGTPLQAKLGGEISALLKAIATVKQLAEEYKHCIKSSCSNCAVYDTEKHYCPKWCDVIKGTVAEIEERYSKDFCEWDYLYSDDEDIFTTDCGESFCFEGGGISDNGFKFCPYCGKKIKVVQK